MDILDGLRDPAIVALVEYFESRLECVILTEYLAGGELFERIADTQYSLTEAKCKGFMRQVGVTYRIELQIKIREESVLITLPIPYNFCVGVQK